MSARLTRRALLRRGGAGAAGVGALGAAGGLRAVRAEAADEERSRNALLIVVPLLRADYVGVYPGKSRADTPNLDRLAKQSVRFEHAVAESMPAWPVRRCLLTGMRSYPFRNWRRSEGMPAVPGFNPIYDHQPLITETLRAGGVEAAWITDNPLLDGPRFEGVRSAGGDVARRSQAAPGIESDFLPSLDRARDAALRSLRSGTRALRELKRDGPFLLAVDGFDPQDAYEAPRLYARPEAIDRLGLSSQDGRLVAQRFGEGEADELGEHYARNVEAVDRELGELLDELDALDLAGDTLVVLIGDHGVALGEHGYIGKAAPTSHRLSHEIAFMVRHPSGEQAGEQSDWFASTHDVPTTLLSYLGLPAPGKMDGEDLTALFDDVDEDDLYHRPAWVSMVGTNILVADHRWLLVTERREVKRWLFDDEEDEEVRFEDVANDEPDDLTRLSLLAGVAAGGTLPEFGPDGVERPRPEERDDDLDGDGIRNDDDPVNDDQDLGDDDHRDDDSRAGALDGGDPTGEVGDFFGGSGDRPTPSGRRGEYFGGRP